MYRTIILPAVLYCSESWTWRRVHEALRGGLEREILRIIYGSVRIDGGLPKTLIEEGIIYFI
jgi:hypothetical protein